MMGLPDGSIHLLHIIAATTNMKSKSQIVEIVAVKECVTNLINQGAQFSSDEVPEVVKILQRFFSCESTQPQVNKLISRS